MQPNAPHARGPALFVPSESDGLADAIEERRRGSTEVAVLAVMRSIGTSRPRCLGRQQSMRAEELSQRWCASCGPDTALQRLQQAAGFMCSEEFPAGRIGVRDFGVSIQASV